MVAAVSLVSKNHRVKLRMLGPFEDENLRSEILRSDKGHLVDYRGIVPFQEVFKHYHGALAGLLILHPVPKLKESMPVKMFECMACGVPLIASDFPLWREIIYDQGCGLVVNPLDVQEIANAIIYLVQNRAEAEKMGRKGIELVRTKYNWEKESCRLLRLYRRLLARGEGAPPSARKQSG
jgi:glycosyltransferase involved in cell wall biosynthesis